MHREEFERVWLRWLGGKPEHAGLGIMTISFLVAILGALVAFSATERNALYWAGYAIVVVGVAGGWFGIIYHRVLLQRRASSPRNDA